VGDPQHPDAFGAVQQRNPPLVPTAALPVVRGTTGERSHALKDPPGQRAVDPPLRHGGFGLRGSPVTLGGIVEQPEHILSQVDQVDQDIHQPGA
jgi:hypothetical protein